MAKGSVNKVILIGRMGNDPDMRFMPNGNAVCSVSIATDEGYKDKNTGQQVDKTEWHRVEAFGKLAEIIGQYLKKGSKVYFEGKLRTDEYEKDGIKRYATKIIANEMTMLDSAQDSQQQGYAHQQQPQMAQQPNQMQQQHPNQGYAPQQAPQVAPQQTQQVPQNNGYAQAQQNPNYPQG